VFFNGQRGSGCFYFWASFAHKIKTTLGEVRARDWLKILRVYRLEVFGVGFAAFLQRP
jgi:hypothetical protein